VTTDKSGSPSQSQSSDTNQKSVNIPITAKTGGQRTTRKSTGPRTALGKQRSSRNSIKYGLYSRALVLEGESLAGYYLLLNDLVKDFQPQGALETLLVENLAGLLWRKRRFVEAEAAMITEKKEFMASDSVAKQYAESWDRTRAPLTTDGLLDRKSVV
jgi:hypothetical protein